MRNRIIVLLTVCLCCIGMVNAQEEKTEKVPVVAPDSIDVAVPDSTVRAVLMAADSVGVPKVELQVKAVFKPSPTKAILLGLVPGLGQIYNRKYWKLPIVYGGLMGGLYAITWNNKNYADYSDAYKDIIHDSAVNPNDPSKWSNSWQVLSSLDPADAIKDTNFKEQLKRRKDYFRRYRDLSIIISVGIYGLSLIDAYVDAQLFDFDISPDLSMRVEPVVTPQTSFSSRSYGLNCSLKF